LLSLSPQNIYWNPERVRVGRYISATMLEDIMTQNMHAGLVSQR